MKKWKRYQQTIADLFRSLGCNAEIERSIQGARARHEIDVWVTFSHFGIQHLWAVECKDCKNRIRKEKVLALKALVEDVGADRGILVAEAGFQRGATDAAKSSNIMLTSISQLRLLTHEELLRSSLIKLEHQADTLSKDIFHLAYINEQTGPNSWHGYTNPAFDGEACGRAFAQLSAVSSGLKNARLGQFPTFVSFSANDKFEVANNLEEFVSSASGLLSEMNNWWAKEKTKAH